MRLEDGLRDQMCPRYRGFVVSDLRIEYLTVYGEAGATWVHN